MICVVVHLNLDFLFRVVFDRSIYLSSAHDGPCNPDGLVGQRHVRDLGRFGCQQSG